MRGGAPLGLTTLHYDDDFLTSLARDIEGLRRRRICTWCIFDNTTLGAATDNAWTLIERLD